MTYATMNWEVEAKRVAAAFGSDEECEFRSCANGDWDLMQGQSFEIPLISNRALEVCYRLNINSRWYCVTGTNADGEDDWTSIEISPNGHVYGVQHFVFAKEIARGLYLLDLLIPEVEAALQVTISVHEKLEWALEFEARYGF